MILNHMVAFWITIRGNLNRYYTFLPLPSSSHPTDTSSWSFLVLGALELEYLRSNMTAMYRREPSV
jgi:hypothetical protein